jgi:phosphoribosylformylglycinamidine (FGAM) synthase-like amidotransferase family enzyme
MRIGVVTFPGSLDDVDAARAVRLAACGTATPTSVESTR